MKFTKGPSSPAEGCAAYLDSDGDLRIRRRGLVDDPVHEAAACIVMTGEVIFTEFNPEDPAAQQRFYEGDSVTITF